MYFFPNIMPTRLLTLYLITSPKNWLRKGITLWHSADWTSHLRGYNNSVTLLTFHYPSLYLTRVKTDILIVALEFRGNPSDVPMLFIADEAKNRWKASPPADGWTNLSAGLNTSFVEKSAEVDRKYPWRIKSASVVRNLTRKHQRNFKPSNLQYIWLIYKSKALLDLSTNLFKKIIFPQARKVLFRLCEI